MRAVTGGVPVGLGLASAAALAASVLVLVPLLLSFPSLSSLLRRGPESVCTSAALGSGQNPILVHIG
jgi:hypothetical protein